MRFQRNFVLSVFCLVLMTFVFMPIENEAIAQTDWCCNNNAPDPQDGFCVPSPQMEQNCNGTNQTFFEDGVDGITLVPLGNGPQFPQSGDLCPNPAQLRNECLCLDAQQQVVPCQTLIPPPPTNPPPTNPPPTNPPPTNPPPTNPPPTNPPPTNPPPTNPPPTNPPPTNPPPTNPPPTNPPPTNPPPTNPPPTNPPPTDSPQLGCCVEEPGVCSLTLPQSCSVPPNIEYLGLGTNCDNVAACNVPPVAEVPTMSEWGLIATAAMLGLFSLFAVKRGFRINNK